MGGNFLSLIQGISEEPAVGIKRSSERLDASLLRGGTTRMTALATPILHCIGGSGWAK